MAKYLFVILAFFIIISQCHAQDANVIQLQKFLSGLGYYQGTIDGVYGPNTATAVSQLQQYLSNKGYYSGSIDGVFGPDTAAAVDAYIHLQKLRANTNTYQQPKSDISQKYTYKESQKNNGMELFFAILAIAITWILICNNAVNKNKMQETIKKQDELTKTSLNTIVRFGYSMNKYYVVLGLSAALAYRKYQYYPYHPDNAFVDAMLSFFVTSTFLTIILVLFDWGKKHLSSSHVNKNTHTNNEHNDDLTLKYKNKFKQNDEQARHEQERRRIDEELARQRAEDARQRYEEEQEKREMQKYFDIFELSDSASFDDFKNKYKIMIKLFHPDRYSSDENVRKYADKKTKELNNAFEILKKYFNT